MLVLHFDGNDRGGVRWKNTRSIKFTFLSHHAQKGLILQPNPIKWWVDFFFCFICYPFLSQREGAGKLVNCEAKNRFIKRSQIMTTQYIAPATPGCSPFTADLLFSGPGTEARKTPFFPNARHVSRTTCFSWPIFSTPTQPNRGCRCCCVGEEPWKHV